MGSPAVDRQKRYLARQQSGHIVLPIVVHEDDLVYALELAGFLPAAGAL
jgi:hypothetical protein